MIVLQLLYDFVWGVPALVLILGVGLYLTVRTRFIQLRLLPKALQLFGRRLFQKDPHTAENSSFQALCTALAATVGTGNLAGVAGAIALGGPGSIFWMWLCGLLGMVLKFAEATLAVRFRVKNSGGSYVGGPMYLLRYALPKPFHALAGIYAFFGVVAAFGVGNATQINTVISAAGETAQLYGFSITRIGKLFLGICLAVLIGSVFLGGANRIEKIAECLIPFAAASYLVLGSLVLVLRWDVIDDAFQAIFIGAFHPQAVTGGMIGSALIALRTGISRGVFTNEAGMGTASIAHASATVYHPAEQGMMGIVEVFLDTIVICTITALVILVSGISIPYGMDAGVKLTTSAFALVLDPWVGVVITAMLCLFALATVLGWGLYGMRCAQYLFGDRAWRCFAMLHIGVIVISSVMEAGVVWQLAEIVNGLMAIPNLIALLALCPELQRLILEYNGGQYENFYQCQSL